MKNAVKVNGNRFLSDKVQLILITYQSDFDKISMTTKKYAKNTLIVIVALFLFTTTISLNPWSNISVSSENESTVMSSFQIADFNIDGNISEWDDPEHKVGWYMDADPENSDGNNYMYLAEDPDNLYIAVDLCSDQTGSTTEEWIGIWLNTNDTDTTAFTVNERRTKWYNALDAGLESLIFDTEHNRTYPFISENNLLIGTYNEYTDFDEFTVQLGERDGLATSMNSAFDNNYVNITSEHNGTHYLYRIDYNVTLRDFYEFFPDIFANHTQDLEIHLESFFNTTIDEHFLTVLDINGTFVDNQTASLHTGTSEGSNVYFNYRENYTTDQYTILSFNGIHSAPFNVSWDYLRTYFHRNQTSQIATGSVDYPYSSIKNYEVNYTFGTTENNNTAHRVYEFKIPKSELQNYSADTELGVLIGGYGTLAGWPNTHNWVYSASIQTGIPEQRTAEYLYYNMTMKGMVLPDAPTLQEISPDPTEGLEISLDWDDNDNTDSWNVYRHTEEITDSNLDSASMIATEITDSNYTDTVSGLGTYWYAVVANNILGSSPVSNSESVSVVDATNPQIAGPADFAYDYGESGQMINWTCEDEFPESYTIHRNGTQVASGEWDGSDISHTIGDLNPGVYNFTLILEDEGGNTASDTVIVTVNTTTTTDTSTTTTTESTTTTTTTETTTTPPDPTFDPMLLVAGAGVGAAVILLGIVYFLQKK